MRSSLAFYLFVGLALVGCGEDATGGGGTGATAGNAGSAAGGTASGGAAGAAGSASGGAAGVAGSGAGAPGLGAPVLEQIMPMSPGGLHLMWSNTQLDCDEIEGERTSGTAEYAVAFKVPGSADNKHDPAPTPGVINTYRLRCQKGGVYSDYSNEKSATP